MRFAIFALAATALSQDFSGIQVERVSYGHGYTDSPLWSKASNSLLFCDVPAGKILAFIPGQGVAKYRENMEGPSAIAYDHEGRLLVAQTKARRIIRLYPGDPTKFDIVAERFEGKRLNAPNDLTVRKDGHIFFTDPAFGAQADRRELDFNGVFHVTPKGEISLLAKLKGRPNGITLSPNGRILYVSSADERRVYAWDIDGKGLSTNERVFFDQVKGPAAGLRVDEKGNVYIAASGIHIVSPQGKELYHMPMGDRPSSIAFGDEDRMTLYITAKTAVYRARMKVKGVVTE